MIHSIYSKIEEVRQFLELKTNYKNDWIGPTCIIILAIIGVFFIYSAQSYTQGTLWKSQITWILLGSVTYLISALIDYKFWLKNAHWIYWIGVLLLIPLAIQAILIQLNIPVKVPFTQTRWGATRWLDLHFISLQPSEIAKVGVLMLTSTFLVSFNLKNLNNATKILAKCIVITSIPLFLIFLQPDLGSAFILPLIIFGLLYVSQFPKKFFLGIFAASIISLIIVSVDVYLYQKFKTDNQNTTPKVAYEDTSWVPLKDYQRNRLLGFIAPSLVDPKGTGIAWNRNQSLYTIASGKLIGKGLGKGTQAKLGYLPATVATNDFIFSVISEEVGLLGALGVIGIFTLLLLNNIRIASLSRDRFGTLLTIGITIVLTVHFFVNIGMTLGIMPITGLPLPFISYGGSFFIVCCLLQGIVQSVHRLCRN